MIRLLGIACGIWLGWHWATGGGYTLAIGIIATVVLSLGNLMIARREWKIRPGRVAIEAIEKAFVSPDVGEVDQVLTDLAEMRATGRPTGRVIWRDLAVTAAQNALTLLVAGGIAGGVSTLVAGTGWPRR